MLDEIAKLFKYTNRKIVKQLHVCGTTTVFTERIQFQ